MNKTIIVREVYDWLTEQELSAAEMDKLVRYVEKNYPNERVVELQYKRLRFINFVGVIQCGGVRIEIVPKIALTKKDDQKALLQMLAVTDFFPIRFFELVKSGKNQAGLLSAFVGAFTERLLVELRKGVFQTYERKESNLHVMRGKLALSQHVRANPFQKTRAYCTFDERSEDNDLNRLLKKALLIVKKHIQTPRLNQQINQCLGYLAQVDETKLEKILPLESLLNRQSERFRATAQFSRMIVEKASIYSKDGGTASFSFLFPMNQLFEAYIGAALIQAAGPEPVTIQPAKKRLLRNQKTGYRSVLLKPDFMVGDRLIIDAKWKGAQVNGSARYEQSDIYQMYAYVTAYKNATRCLLIYPKQDDAVDYPVWEVTDTEKTIEMHTVRVDSFLETVRALKKLMKNKEDN